MFTGSWQKGADLSKGSRTNGMKRRFGLGFPAASQSIKLVYSPPLFTRIGLCCVSVHFSIDDEHYGLVSET